jgi:acetoin utilization deacetylase AcuC-like enzyme
MTIRHALKTIPVFYADAMLAAPDSYSPSAQKPRHVLAAWQDAGLPVTVTSFTPVDEADLGLAHDPTYVRDILNCKTDNGFFNRAQDVADSLPYTTGAMLAAARAALKSGCACAPVSGFHHAGYDYSGGFCTFNGLVVAARRLLEENAVRRVLILDCDMHYGDGTEAILKHFHLKESIRHTTFGRWFREPRQARSYLRLLRKTVSHFPSFDLILYQAGADVHINDPLGGVLTSDEMIERDRTVFEAARAAGTPIAWNLAGGYQVPLTKVIELHVNTMRECVRVYAAPDAGRSV